MIPLANPLQPLIDVFEQVLIFFHDSVGLGWGFSIVALTVTIRAILLPLTLKQVRSMRQMQMIAPEMKKLQKKYKDDKQRLNQEMMKLYSEHKVNPFASCLPLLAQLPVFISLFYMLQDDLREDICGQSAKPCGTSDAAFLFIEDITDKATGVVLLSLIVLYVASQLVSSLLMSVSADKNQRMIFLALPFVFIPFVINFPAGLLVYWITTNLWTIVQQFIVRRVVGPVQTLGDVKDEADKDEDSGGGGLRGMLASAGAGAQKPAATGSVSAAATSNAPRRSSAPPPPPSKRKKKRSGRRR